MLVAPPAWADLFSPGDLIEKHKHLEGVSNCDACHPKGDQLSAQKCLTCHTELAGQVARGKGYHGRLPAAEREACEKCHHDHQGRKQAPTEWGPGGIRGFPHDKTGWPLEKGHELKCDECHRANLLALPEVAAWVKKYPGCDTYLGAPRACKACHFDEHRGAVSETCDECHDAVGWKKTPRYNHVKNSKYPLKGKHKKVACKECHRTVEDEKPPAAPWPKPVNLRYLELAPVAHDTCLTCHDDDDVHKGKYGKKCESCHTEASWTTLKADAMDRKLHDKYRYPLEGAHAQVDCAPCHGPWPGIWPKAKYKDLPFENCTDCHQDAHLGQLKKDFDCSACHLVQSFKPTTFDLKAHQKTRWPLEGAHRAVACTACHVEEPALAAHADPKARAAMRARGRPETVSLMRLAFPKNLEACETCHADVHQGQFEKQTCDACHEVESFRGGAFDHDKKTDYPLEGAHKEAPCAGCHPTQTVKGRQVTKWKPVEKACAGCHADTHLGQFGRRPDCGKCHGAKEFEKDSKFEHLPPFTEYRLEGAHAQAKCAACHPEAQVAKGEKARLYKPLPTRCAGCHVDHHEGEFKGFMP